MEPKHPLADFTVLGVAQYKDPILGEMGRAVLVRDGVVFDGPIAVDTGKLPPTAEGVELVMLEKGHRAGIGWTVDAQGQLIEPAEAPIDQEHVKLLELAQQLKAMSAEQLTKLSDALNADVTAEEAEPAKL